MTSRNTTRRAFLAGTALVAGATLAAPFIRSAHAAGKLSIGFWDHWVPGANDTLTKLCNEWAEKEKVEIQIDYITSQGNKNILTAAAEMQARAGHDILQLPTWQPIDTAPALEPMDDLMADLIAANGDVNDTVKYLGQADGHWVAVPATTGSQIKGPCSRIDLLKQHAGVDIQAIYPAGSAPKDDDWTLDAFIQAAEKCHAGGNPFGIGLGVTTDSIDAVGAFFHAFGADLADANGDPTVGTDNVKQALDYMKRLSAVLPGDVAAWDDASNNKFLVSGQASMIMNPPSAWAVAKRDAMQVAEQCWTHGMPKGPNGRFAPYLPYFLGLWEFSENKSAAKSLIRYISQRSSVEQLVKASAGYDLPSFAGLTDFPVWSEEGPPKGTLYHYPDPHHRQTLSIAGAPAPANIAYQIYNQGLQTKMVVRYAQGESMDSVLSWAESELEGYMRG